jgi:4-hydroxy-4-methyl-2-oxoglutarate aldolase
MTQVSQAVLEKLQRFDTPTICNLIELFEIRPRNQGYMDSRIKACYPEMPPIVGYASTATFRADAPPPKGAGYDGLEQQLESFEALDGPAIVVFQDLDDPSVAATFGEVMCSSYQAFGAQGLITSGTGRDLEQVRALNFPVFTNGAICSHGYVHMPQLNVPVRVGGLMVYPNDLLHADANGITNIPRDIAADVADIGDDFIAAEMIIIDLVKKGKPSLKAYQDARAHSKDMIETLRKKVSTRF